VNELNNDGDPWSPVDLAEAAQEPVEPPAELEIKGGNVTAHINLGGDTAPPAEESTEEGKVAATDDSDTKGDGTAAEVETAEEDLSKKLAEKLAALDAAKAGRKTKK
jgi:hypothetical protein